LKEENHQQQQHILLQHLVDSSVDGIMAFDTECRYTAWNRAMEKISGMKREQVIGRVAFEVFPFLKQTGEDKCFYEALAGRTAVSEARVYFVPESGRRGFFDGYYSPVFDERGRVMGGVGIIRDVTHSRQTEEERARLTAEVAGQRLRLSNIVASVPGVVWEAWGQPDTSAQEIDFVSDYVEEMLGYTKEEWLSEPNFWLKIVHPEDRERAAQNAAEHFALGGPGVNRFRWMAKDGRTLWVESHSAVITGAEGQPIGMRGVTFDITERVMAEEAMARYQLLSRLSRDIMLFIRPDGRVVEANYAAVAAYGYSREELLTKSIKDLRAPETISLLDSQLRQADEKGILMETTHVRNDGSAFTVEVSATGADVAGERLILSVIRDITERKAAERERELLLESESAARVEAERANHLKDEFLATLSHELRTPLTAILGWAKMLSGGNLDANTSKQAVEVIKRNAESQKQIVEDVLDASRIITGKLRIEPERVELLGVVREALDSVRPAAAAKKIDLICNFDPHVGVIIGDPNRLRQIVWNLLSNAVKFTEAGGRVKIEAGRSLSSVRLTVSDTGQGITSDFLPYVFDRFRQADGSTTRQHGGLGLGLSIVKHLAEAHGGSVHAYSAGTGQGASFTVELPLPAAPTQLADEASSSGAGNGNETASRAPGPPALLGVRVLLVEDDTDTLEMTKVFLKKNGAEVIAFSSAAAALEMLKGSRPDVIVSDIGMPEIDGYELMRRVRSLGAEAGGLIPAIALTAYATDADRLQALRAGFQTHVSKPVDPDALLAAIATLAARAGADK
jgi:PAS domain S-box-containing protein